MEINRKSLLTSAVLGVATVAIVFICYIVLGMNIVDNKENVSIDKGWTVKINDEVYENIDLNTFRFPHLKKGDTAELTNVLPEQLPPCPTMSFLTKYASVDVYVNDKNIYSYGDTRIEDDKLLGCGNHWISFEGTNAGGEIRVLLRAGEDNAFNEFKPIIINSSDNTYRNFIRYNLVPGMIGIFLIVFGLILFITSTMMLVFNKEFMKLCCIALFAFFVGIWILCTYNILQLISPQLWVKSYAEFISLFLTPLPIIILFYDTKSMSEKAAVFINVLWWLNIMFCITAIFLQAANIVHFYNILFLFQLLLFTDAVYFIYLSLKDIKNKELNTFEKSFTISILVLLLFGAGEVLRYNVQRFFGHTGIMSMTSIMPVGAVVFVLIIVISYCIYIFEMLKENAENKFLSKLAYSDYLTKVSNRTKCELIFKELDENPCEYAILDFDLNNLKVVNDALGHLYGDELIKNFANMLTECFGEFGTVGRMGGDEFIVILKNVTPDIVHERIEVMSSTISAVNAKDENKKLQISVSYGYAFSDEVSENDVSKVYKLADERMYIMKGLMK